MIVEYGIKVALIAVVAIGSLIALSIGTTDRFLETASYLEVSGGTVGGDPSGDGDDLITFSGDGFTP